MKVFAYITIVYALSACGGGVGFQRSIDDGPGVVQSNDSYAGPIHSAGGWLDTLTIYVASESPEIIEEATLNVVDTWNEAAGRDILAYGGIAATPAIDSLYGSLDDDFTVIYTTARWASVTSKPGEVVGTAVWESAEGVPSEMKDERNLADEEYIAKGDVILNRQNYVFQDTDLDPVDEDRIYSSVDAESVILHEIGHVLGLDHSLASDDGNSVMLPKATIGIGIHNRVVSEGDIERIRSIYNRDSLTLN